MRLLVLLTISLSLPAVASAQPHPPRQDPGKAGADLAVELPEIVINVLSAPESFTSIRITADEVRELDAAAASEVMRLIPGARVQTNSRGETLVYMRNAGERQVAVFLDGALLNVPWDNRIDLGFLPAPLIGGISVVQGVVPIEFGANVMGGAINLTSPPWQTSGRGSAEAQAGTEARVQGSASYRGLDGPWRYSAGASYASIAGLAIPAGADLPFGQPGTVLRTNTDSRMASVSGQLIHVFPGGEDAGFSGFYVDGEKGIAPEGHKDPEVSKVRYWRYPIWRSATGILNGRGSLGDAGEWRAAGWVNYFAQTIEAYTSAAFDAHQAREVADDLTFGARITGQTVFGKSTLKLALNALASVHNQLNLDLQADGQPVAGKTFAPLRFSQAILSGGLEYGIRPVDDLVLTAGASVDSMLPLATGDKPSLDPFVTYGATLGASWKVLPGWHLRASLGRKARFPTMRELFGEALNTFLANPDLKPESAIIAEVGFGLDGDGYGFEVVPFGMFTSDTIDQQSVRVPGEAKPRRQRINLKGSRILGVEASGNVTPVANLALVGSLTYSSARRLQEEPTDPVYLAEKPAIVGRVAATYAPATGPTGQAEAIYTAGAYSMDDTNAFVALPSSFILNLRAGFRFALPGERWMEFFVRVNNVTDAVEVQQLGLPSAGRTLQGGLVAGF